MLLFEDLNKHQKNSFEIHTKVLEDNLSPPIETEGNLSSDPFNKVHVIKLLAAQTNASQSNHLPKKYVFNQLLFKTLTK